MDVIKRNGELNMSRKTLWLVAGLVVVIIGLVGYILLPKGNSGAPVSQTGATVKTSSSASAGFTKTQAKELISKNYDDRNDYDFRVYYDGQNGYVLVAKSFLDNDKRRKTSGDVYYSNSLQLVDNSRLSSDYGSDLINSGRGQLVYKEMNVNAD